MIHLKKILHHQARILLQAISTVVHGATLATEEVVRTESTVAAYFNILLLSAADQYNYVYCTRYVSIDQKVSSYDGFSAPACSTASSLSTVMQNRAIKR